MSTVEKSFCRVCHSYCGLSVEIENGVVQNVRGDRNHPVSEGYTCVKGRSMAAIHHSPNRLRVPRAYGLEGTWDGVLGDLADRITAIVKEDGYDALGFYRGTASYYDAAGLSTMMGMVTASRSKSLFTTSSIDCAPRFWAAEQMCDSWDVTPVIDFGRTRMTLLLGTNPVVSHGHQTAWPNPVGRIRKLLANGEVWVVDVRETETTRLATRSLQPRPGTEWALLAYVIRELLIEGADLVYLDAHCSGVGDLTTALAPVTADVVSNVCQLDRKDADDLVTAIRRYGRLAVQTGTGTTMTANGDVTEWLAWTLMAVTGSFDQAGGVWFNPGGYHRRDGGLPSNPEAGPTSRPDLVGRYGERPTVAIADEIEAGNIRAMIVVGGNPLRAVPGTKRLADAFAKLDVLAVADVVDGPTVQAATHVLPCAAQLEREDLSTIEVMGPKASMQYTPALLPRFADTRTMADLFLDLGARLGWNVADGAADASEVLRRMAGARRQELWNKRVLTGDPDYGWFTREVLPEGGWRLAPQPFVTRIGQLCSAPVSGPTLNLAPRRENGHLNSFLAGLHETAKVYLHPDTAATRGIVADDIVIVASAGGQVRAVAKLDPRVRLDVLSLPHGYDDPNVGSLVTDCFTVHAQTGMPVLAGVSLTITKCADQTSTAAL